MKSFATQITKHSISKRVPLQLNNLVRCSASSGYPGANFDGDARRVNIYADYKIYKAKGAITLKVIRPTWERVPTGSGMTVARPGTLLLEFANSRGDRDYTWDEKETFGLNAAECGDVLDVTEVGKDISFFHDPYKMSSSEGMITKTLKLVPGRESGYFLTLSVNNKQEGKQLQFSTPVSNGELRVMRTIMEFAIPRLLGFDEVFTAATPDIRESSSGGGGMGSPYGERDAPPF